MLSLFNCRKMKRRNFVEQKNTRKGKRSTLEMIQKKELEIKQKQNEVTDERKVAFLCRLYKRCTAGGFSHMNPDDCGTNLYC